MQQHLHVLDIQHFGCLALNFVSHSESNEIKNKIIAAGAIEAITNSKNLHHDVADFQADVQETLDNLTHSI